MKVVFPILGTILMLTGCGNNQQGAPSEENGGEVVQSHDAEKLVQGNCTSCHGGNLEGQGNFPALNNVGSRLSEEEILHVIQNGQGAMPAHIIEGVEAEVVAEWLSKKI